VAGPDYGSTLLVEELDARTGSTRRSVELVGPGLPHMGASWKSAMKVVTTWYAGNGDEATQQVLGPRELPSQWDGEWHQTMMVSAPSTYTPSDGSGPQQIVNPMDLVSALESIWRSGLRLRVTWAVSSGDGDPGKNGKIVREGRAVEWDLKPDRWQDVSWQVTYEWLGRGSRAAPKLTQVRAGSTNTESAALQAKLQALIAAQVNAQLYNQRPTFLNMGQLERLASAPTALVNQVATQVQRISASVGQAVSVAQTAALQPISVQQRAAQLGRDAVSQAHVMSDQLGRIPYELQTNRVTATSVLLAARQYAQFRDKADDVAAAGLAYALKLQQQRQAAALSGKLASGRNSGPETVAQVYVARDGDTPQLVSQRAYGSPDHAVDILRNNRLPWHTPTFTPGQILIIPALSATQQGSGV
jgi:hypothetical protein